VWTESNEEIVYHAYKEMDYASTAQKHKMCLVYCDAASNVLPVIPSPQDVSVVGLVIAKGDKFRLMIRANTNLKQLDDLCLQNRPTPAPNGILKTAKLSADRYWRRIDEGFDKECERKG
jgi:hypothetical protein